VGSADTATAATHYFVEIATDGFVRPKTIANVRTEIVTNAAVLAGIGTLPVANGGTGTSTAFTTGSVVFAGASGVYSQNNAQLFWDNTNNYLGVGTASPASPLDVVGQSNLRGFTRVQALAQPTFGQYANLELQDLYPYSSFPEPGILLSGIYDSLNSVTSFANISAIKVNATDGDASANLKFCVSNTTAGSLAEAMRIQYNGNVGIGSASPAYKLDVAGIVRTTGQFISTQSNSATTGGGQIYLSGNGGNRIDFINQGVAAPAFTTRSAGTKIVLFPTSLPATETDFALGIESSVLWSSIPGSTRSFV
jgi:hypothetical protein